MLFSPASTGVTRLRRPYRPPESCIAVGLKFLQNVHVSILNTTYHINLSPPPKNGDGGSLNSGKWVDIPVQ